MKDIKNFSFCCSITLALLAFAPLVALADTLYTTQGNSLFQFNTALGAGSQITVTNFNDTITTTVAVDTHSNVFVATDGNLNTDKGDLYEITANGALHTIATGLDFPDCLAVDSQGDVFEVDQYGDNTNINEYINTAGTLSSTPVTFTTDDGDGVAGIAFDSQGDLFAVDGDGIYEFTNNAGTLSATATYFASYGYFLSSLAFDTNGDLFVSEGGSVIYEFINTAGTLSSAPIGFVFNSIDAYSLAVDSHNNLFISDIATGNGNIYELSIQGLSINGGVVPTPAIFASGLYVGGLSFLPVIPPPPPPKLYVAGDESIYSFAPPAGSASEQTITNDLVFEPVAMAVDSNGDLFQSDGLRTLYEIPKKGAPFTFASGMAVAALAFDTNGDLFAWDGDTFNIYEFSNNAGTLSTTPTLFIAGLECESLAFDSKGDLFISNGSQIKECFNNGGILSSSPSFFDDEGFYASLAFDANGNLFAGYADTFFFANPSQGAVQEYVFNNSANWNNGGVLSSKPITIATANVASLACDASGNVYEVDGDDGNVYQFANNAGTLSPTRTLYAGGLDATCEASGVKPNVQTPASTPNLYVTDADHNTTYSFNSTNGPSTKATLSSVGVGGTSIGSVAFDNNGDLWVSDDSYLYEIPRIAGALSPSNTIPIDEIGVSLGCGGGTAFDNNGNVYVGDYSYAGINLLTNVAGAWDNFPLDDPNPWLGPAGYAYSLAFDSSRTHLFDAGGGYLFEFGNLGGAYETQTRILFPTPSTGGVAVDANGDLFAGDGNFIYEFTNTPDGVSTTGTIFGSGLSDVSGLAFDATGNLFVADGTSGNVYEYLSVNGVLQNRLFLFASGLFNAAGVAVYIPPAPSVPPSMIHLVSSFQPPNDGQPAQLVISWPSAAAGFMLQTNGTLTTSGWGSYTGPTNTSQGMNTVTVVPQSTGSLFFRLMHN